MSTTAATVLLAITDLERGLERERATPYAVARISFSYRDRSVGLVQISKGERVYDICHEAVAARPDAFDIVGGKRKRSSRPELNTAATSRPRRDDVLRRPSWALPVGEGLLSAGPVERRDATSPVGVRVSSRTRDDIAAACAAVPRTHETGGMLIARHSYDRRAVDLIEAWRPGASSELRSGSVALDWKVEHRRARDYVKHSGGGVILAGCWHVHPRGGNTPSEPDLKMFGAAMRHVSDTVWPLSSYVAIIATSVGRAAGPDLTAWVTREDHGRMVCERAVIA